MEVQTKRGTMNNESEKSLDRLFRILAHSSRRHAIVCLQDRSESVTITELAAEIHAREQPSAGSEEELDKDHVVTALHHTHIPKLEEAGLIRFDPAQKTVVPTDRMEDVTSLLPEGYDQ
jgi:DNA-binding transcriptional ArsR family regulator